MTIPRLIGVLLLILVGYHYINEPLGFSLSGSVATVIFGICLTSVYRSYHPDQKNWIGWGLLAGGCLVLGNLSNLITAVVILPLLMIIIGFKLTELSFGSWYYGGRDHGGFGGGDSCDGGGGGDC
ncbi:MAG: hypothetical protein MI754_16605 [Chromatiales bacterium]|nr:hypothetical protein [Chromatiales bacterium]